MSHDIVKEIPSPVRWEKVGKKLHQIGQTQFVDLNEIMRKLCLIDKYRSCHDQEWMKRVRNQICL